MDLIVTACRALANHTRLRLLRRIYLRPGLAVRAVAAKVGQTPAATSQQLKLLCHFHYIEAVPQGRQVFYRPARVAVTVNPFLQGLRVLLGEIMSAKEWNRTPLEVCAKANASDEAMLEALVKLFTTYTHLRRLLLLRQLAAGAGDTAVELAERIRMSPDAVYRHLDKLRRRGVVCYRGTLPESWQVAAHRGPTYREKLLKLVLQTLHIH